MTDGRTREKPDEEALKRERNELLQRLEDWLETPMLVLGFVWLVLLAVESIRGESLLFVVLGTIIWVVFILDFAVKFVLAPDKVVYLKGNWLLPISLLIPRCGSSASFGCFGYSVWRARGGGCSWFASSAR